MFLNAVNDLEQVSDRARFVQMRMAQHAGADDVTKFMSDHWSR